jgi:hypothetical protein
MDELKGQAKLGLAMMKNKRMHLKFDRIRGLSEVKRLYRKAKEKAPVR